MKTHESRLFQRISGIKEEKYSRTDKLVNKNLNKALKSKNLIQMCTRRIKLKNI